MYCKKNRPLLFLLLITLLGGPLSVYAQWGAPYSNSWITYSKPYVKIAVTKKGIHKLPFAALPADFPVNAPSKMQMWHRGKQIAILSTSNNEITFYGVPNDGALDSLLYRPMSGRLNPYNSLYSDQSAYFLTVGDSDGVRAKVINQAVDESIEPTTFHNQTDVTAFSNEWSLSTLSAIRAEFFNSFFENGASKTGVTVIGEKVTSYKFKLTDWSVAVPQKPVLKLMIHGRSIGPRSIEISVGRNDQSLRLVHSLPNSNSTASVYSFNLEPSDIDESGNGVLSLKSVTSDLKGRYSLSFYTISYPQSINMGKAKSYDFKFKGSTSGWARINVNNAPANSTVYDITDKDVPGIIEGKVNNLMIPVKTGADLDLYVTSEIISVDKSSVTGIDLKKLDPKSYNYIIITSANLKEGAESYAKYRSSKEGGSFKTIVAEITDIYNQFNFGEPSPVGIRRFMDYMLSDNSKEKYLFLIGKSITFNERMIRELPNEVPTIGFPGSDLLLVEGLAGSLKETPAIPVGRLSALNNQHIYDYLEKVKEFEDGSSEDVSWQKNVLHLNGGHSALEINQLKNILDSLAPVAQDGLTGAKVKHFVKQQGIQEVEQVNITPEVNAGVGLLTYFGHGSTTVTDLNIGYATDAARAYSNRGKYPLMYFNGCGVGNVFSGRFNTSPSSSDRIALSLDWILAPNRGTVAILANTFEAYVSSTANYLKHLYKAMFLDSETSNMSIGNLHREVAKRILLEGNDFRDVGNVHQTMLQGDPALHMTGVGLPDYFLTSNESIILHSDLPGKTIGNSAILKTAVVIRNQGRYNKNEKVPLTVKYIYEDGSQVAKDQTVPAIAYMDTIYVAVPVKENLKRVEVKIDPEQILVEQNKANNAAELIVDWHIARDKPLYPTETSKDMVPPILDVFFDGRVIMNGESVAPEPEISFVLSDDRLMTMDTSLLTIFIKSCPDYSCDFVKLDFSNVTLSQLSDRSFRVTYTSSLKDPGMYEVLVNAKDKQGASSLNPFKIQFKIDEVPIKVSVVSSPNPASNYVRFHAEGYDTRNLQNIKYTIYNLKGVEQANYEFTPLASSSDWYWTPKVGSGMYIYKAEFSQKAGNNSIVTGKVVIER